MHRIASMDSRKLQRIQHRPKFAVLCNNKFRNSLRRDFTAASRFLIISFNEKRCTCMYYGTQLTV